MLVPTLQWMTFASKGIVSKSALDKFKDLVDSFQGGSKKAKKTKTDTASQPLLTVQLTSILQPWIN